MKTRTELENELKLLESGADAIREQLAAMPMQWEPESGAWRVKGTGVVGMVAYSDDYIDFGTGRKTREAAERAAIEMRKFNRLLAYRDEFSTDYDPDRSELTVGEYCVYFDHARKRWIMSRNRVGNVAGAVYMPLRVAAHLCHRLNSGEVVL